MTSRHMEVEQPTRRNFLFVTTGAFAAVGVPFAVWPFVDQMNPDAATVEKRLLVDVGKLEPGESMYIRGKFGPFIVRHRTAKEIASARAVEIGDLRDQSSRNFGKSRLDAHDINRTFHPNGRFLVLTPTCAYFGCLIIADAGDFDGWYCPCCGSHYDTSGRARKGPAPRNLAVPEHRFWGQARLEIHERMM